MELTSSTFAPGASVDVPDAPGSTFMHSLAWGMAPDTQQLAQAESPPGEGRNDFGQVGYRGPCQPTGHGAHRSFFRLFALDGKLTAGPGVGRRDLERAMKGCVVEVAEPVGTLRR